jgi:putative hydrolase of HD superfamily
MRGTVTIWDGSVIICLARGSGVARRRGSGEQELLRFFSQAGRLKSEKRRGWLKKLGMAHPESVADHSYRTALMAMVLSDARGLDTAKAVRLALLHDLPEALVGDAMPNERSGVSKAKLETNAMEELLRGLTPKVRSLYREAWQEFLAGDTEEARLVRQLDKLEMAIQAWEYVKESSDPAVARAFLETARKHVTDGELLEILRQVEF